MNFLPRILSIKEQTSGKKSKCLGGNSQWKKQQQKTLTLLLLNTTCLILANSVDPDQLASEEANWSGSALFVIKCVNF